jgi:hypothetical protein
LKSTEELVTGETIGMHIVTNDFHEGGLMSTRNLLRVVLAALFLTLALAGGRSVSAESAGPEAVSALGIARLGGEGVLVEVTVAVRPGQDAAALTAAALREQGARPARTKELHSAGFTTNGLLWDQFSDGTPGNDFVTQSYNPKGDPTGGAALAALQNTHSTWTNVPGSSFVFSHGGTTNRCPSLVLECPGPQAFDGKNDVGWLKLSGCCTLGVTWFSTAQDEADMALNLRFKWSTTLPTPQGRYDVETVYLHENGHVAGLGHSDVDGAVMEPRYEGVRRGLHADDIAAISLPYP